MGQCGIQITCSATGRSVSTGWRVYSGTDISHIKHYTLRFCPACRKEHVWNGNDARLVELRKRSRWRFLELFLTTKAVRYIRRRLRNRAPHAQRQTELAIKALGERSSVHQYANQFSTSGIITE
jgi:ribosomal protein L28